MWLQGIIPQFLKIVRSFSQKALIRLMLLAQYNIQCKSEGPGFPTALFFVLLACILIVCLLPASAYPSSPKTVFHNETPWQIEADRLIYHRQTGIYTGTGAVVIRKDDITLTADTIIFNESTREALAHGEVLLVSNADRLSGDEMVIDLDAGTGVVSCGELFLEQKHFYIRGDDIRKTGENSFSVTRGSLTSCDGENPDWRITGTQVDVTVEGYGTAKHATLWARRIPVFYVPYIIFPVKLERQSGLLLPQIGFSDRKGITCLQPFFWAINRSADATLYYHHMQKRGEKIGGEYRYALSDDSKGTLMMDGFTDRHIDDGTPEAGRKWGYTDDRAIRPNTDRYWFRMKADQELPWQFNAKLDLDVVSDQDYLREFSSGYTGYMDTEDIFQSRFGRDIDDRNDAERENRLNINRIWTTYSFNTDVAWYDNVINRRQTDTDPTLHHLPRVGLSGLKHPLPYNPFYIDMTSEYTYFYRQDGYTGHRGDFHPRLYLPLHWGNYLALEPSAGFRQTAWRLDRHDPDPVETENDDHREMFDFRVDLSSDLYRFFDVNAVSFERIKHILAPKVQYLYIPEKDQSDFPFFDDLDRIEETHRIALSLTNLLTPERSRQETAESYGQNLQQTQQAGRPLARLYVEQPYDLKENKSAETSSFAPLYAQLEIDPAPHLSFRTDAEWDHDKGQLDAHSIRLGLSDRLENRLFFEHRYRRDAAQTIYVDAAVAVSPSILITGDYERNLEDHQDIRKSIGCRYRAQCWALMLSFTHEENDKSVGFMITLSGLGDIGTR